MFLTRDVRNKSKVQKVIVFARHNSSRGRRVLVRVPPAGSHLAILGHALTSFVLTQAAQSCVCAAQIAELLSKLTFAPTQTTCADALCYFNNAAH